MPTCRMHCVAPTNAYLLTLDALPPHKTCLNARSLLRSSPVMVTHRDKIRADGPYGDGVLRITIACTGVAAARFPLCLHV
ncbi:hypothetical protein LF1_54360 [Rubripirellula obstinata]|uniref:Uncharacterized protein n=1 Tax=Rubripirellula obstinata TaxID=406547 RepID=A0A5B1C866_9BACT|nr:hypothetical protein LF1_54360 [Rubripirellula obstinata]